MHGDSLPIPGVEKISRLIDALRDCALKEAGAFPGESWAASYSAPNLALWDAFFGSNLLRTGRLRSSSPPALTGLEYCWVVCSL
jgi:hypothetical protein